MGNKSSDYSKKLKNPKWQKKRLEIFKRDKFRCRICKDDENELHIHHKEYISDTDPWDYPNELLITLCEHCHHEIEHLKSEYPEVSFKEIRIHKQTGWTNGFRIVIVSFYGHLLLRIYDGQNNFMDGYNFTHGFRNIRKLIDHSING